MIDVIYYAHSLKIYDTEREKQEIAMLEACFPGDLIYNPNNPYIQAHRSPMRACFNVIADPIVTILAFSVNDGKFVSLGVHDEVKAAQKKGLRIFEILDDSVRMFSRELRIVGRDKDLHFAKVE